MGAAFQIRKGEKEFLGQIGSRLSAGRGLLQGRACTPRRRGQICSRLSASRSFKKKYSSVRLPGEGVTFLHRKVTKKSFGLRPKDPTRRYTPPGKPKRRLPGAGLDDAYKVSRTHFYVKSVIPVKYLLAIPLVPPPLRRDRGGGSPFRAPAGGLKYAAGTLRAYLRCCTDDAFGSFVFSRSLAAKRFERESSVPLCPVLLPFAGAKEGPPRRAVLSRCKGCASPPGDHKLSPRRRRRRGTEGRIWEKKGGKLNKKACCISMLGGQGPPCNLPGETI